MLETLERPRTFEDIKKFDYRIYFPGIKYEKERNFKSEHEAEKYVKILLYSAKKIAEHIEDGRDIKEVKNLLIRHLAFKGYEMFELKEWISEISNERWYNAFKENDIFHINCYKKEDKLI